MMISWFIARLVDGIAVDIEAVNSGCKPTMTNKHNWTGSTL